MGGIRSGTRGAAALLVLLLVACSSQAAPSLSAFHPLRMHRHPGDVNGSVHWLSSEGVGIATVDCGAPFVVIAGGASSSTATDIGEGYPGPSSSSWQAQSADSKAYIFAYALCAPAQGLSAYFYRVSARASKKQTTATVSCGKGDALVAGWGGYFKWDDPVLSNGKPSGWTAGGYPGTTATAECATAAEVSATGMTLTKKTSGAGRLYLACDGDTDDVLGGAYGSGTGSGASSGPPATEYPAVASGAGSINPTGLAFTSKKPMTGWILCQEDGSN